EECAAGDALREIVCGRAAALEKIRFGRRPGIRGPAPEDEETVAACDLQDVELPVEPRPQRPCIVTEADRAGGELLEPRHRDAHPCPSRCGQQLRAATAPAAAR